MIPKYLFQYTKTESLKKILENQTIKFNRLDLLNDPLEGIFSIDNNKQILEVRKFLYCSCWTDNEDENISMWGLYGGFEGFRIKIKSNIFSEKFSWAELESGFVPVGEIAPIHVEDKSNSTKQNLVVQQVLGPIRINYVRNIDDTYLNAVKCSEESDIEIPQDFFKIDLFELGNRKVDYWKYENEWRFLMSAIINVVGSHSVFDNIEQISIDYQKEIFVPIQIPIIEIMAGPCTKSEDIEMIGNIIKEKKLNIPIVKSKIKINK